MRSPGRRARAREARTRVFDLPPGTSGEISRITTEDAEAIEYLHGLGIRPGSVIVLEGVAPFDGPASVRVKGNLIHLGRRLAQALHVREEGKRKRAASVKPAGTGLRRA